MDFLPSYSIEDVVRYWIAIVIFISMILTVVYIIWWWLLMVVSGWDENKVKAAVNHMRYAVLGIVVLIVTIFIVPLFLNLLGLSAYGQYFAPSEIFNTLKEITANVFGSTSDTVINWQWNVLPSVNDPGFTNL